MSNKKGPTYGNGKICYLELPAINIKQSAAFYMSVFGWKNRERKDGSLAFDDAVGEVSGTFITGRKPSVDPGMLVYIMVDNIESTLELINMTGGKTVQPVGMDLPEITARFSDPAGNVLGLYQQPS